MHIAVSRDHRSLFSTYIFEEFNSYLIAVEIYNILLIIAITDFWKNLSEDYKYFITASMALKRTSSPWGSMV